MKLFVFPSQSLRNIAIGVENHRWAVPYSEHTSVRKQYTTKSGKMPVGAHGLFYCSRLDQYTMPFIVGSQPNPDQVLTDIWEGSFFLPFDIHPLGKTDKLMSMSEIRRHFPSFNTDDVERPDFSSRKNDYFSDKCEIAEGDWAVLIERLGAYSGNVER